MFAKTNHSNNFVLFSTIVAVTVNMYIMFIYSDYDYYFRPPGHHALQSEYCGYCFFNNVALAAEYALRKFNLSRILIVDWDVHHGQATQRVFYDDPR